MENEPRTYTGGCHCGQVRYQVELNVQAGGNSSNTDYWGALVRPAAFRLLAGQDSLCDYTSESRSVHHLFCKHCHTRSFCRGDIPEIGGAYITVDLKCLDDVDLSSVRIKHSNGRHDWS